MGVRSRGRVRRPQGKDTGVAGAKRKAMSISMRSRGNRGDKGTPGLGCRSTGFVAGSSRKYVGSMFNIVSGMRLESRGSKTACTCFGLGAGRSMIGVCFPRTFCDGRRTGNIRRFRICVGQIGGVIRAGARSIVMVTCKSVEIGGGVNIGIGVVSPGEVLMGGGACFDVMERSV